MGRLKQFDLYWCDLEPAFGHQMKKVRPCVIISPESVNDVVATVIIAPMTTTVRSLPFRVTVKYGKHSGSIACDQIRAIDKTKVRHKYGTLTNGDATKLSEVLASMFAVAR